MRALLALGVGFAIGIDLAVIVAEQLVAGEEVRLAFLGVSTTSSTSSEPGALVQEVVAGSAAEAAGVEVGDLVVSVNGQPIRDGSDLRVRIITTPPEATVDIDLIRNGDPLTLNATLGTTDG